MDTKPTKPGSPEVQDAARDALRQETETSGLTPDQRTVMKAQETGNKGQREMRPDGPSPSPGKWPFPPSTDYLPEEPHDSVK